MTKDQIRFEAQVWSLSERAVKRWLEHETPPPFSKWHRMPDWSAGLSAKTECKLTNGFTACLYAASELLRNPTGGTVAMGMWITAAIEEEAAGAPRWTLPRTLVDWVVSEGWLRPPVYKNPELGRRWDTAGDMAETVGFFQNRLYEPRDFPGQSIDDLYYRLPGLDDEERAQYAPRLTPKLTRRCTS